MSDSTKPSRRRIAGESKPVPPTTKPAARKVPARKAAAKKAAMQQVTTPPPADKKIQIAAFARKTLAQSSVRDASIESAQRGSRWLVPLSVVTAAVLVLGLTFFVKGVLDVRGRGADFDASRDQAVSAASTSAETIFSFSSDKLDQHESASKAIMTKKFAKDFETVAPALGDVTANRAIEVKAVAREAAPLPCGDECSPNKVDVLVFLDQARLVGSSKQPTVFANRISVSMVKTDEGWLVDNIRAL